ncbi:50S ribosomal protein L34e [archaeon]|jgi:large subunit ribosomal protein L34e|nr:50S ribosomal protein L34e [archaeon]
MPEPRFRSRTFKRVKKKLPGGSTVTHYEKRRPKQGTCPVTGETLKGVARERPTKLKSIGKSKKRPTRPFGGVLSSRAARDKIKQEAREQK